LEKGDVVKKYRARRFRRYERRRRRKSRVVSTLALLIVLAGLGLVGYALLGEDSPLKAVSDASKDEEEEPASVKDTKLKLTIPEMERVQDLDVYDTPWDDESALETGAQHLQGTGFPWEEESNVFIAGHRLGYLGTDSYLVFWDLDSLEEGDEVFLTDSDGTRYTYEVFENFVTGPYDWSVTEPVSGKNIVTLQTCTLPDYADRIIVQAELTNVEPGQGVEPEQDEPAAQEDQAVPVESLPDEPLPAEPLPVEPTPIEPLPAEPIPDQPAQQPEPLPVDPAPIGPPAQAA
jgi:sortase A